MRSWLERLTRGPIPAGAVVSLIFTAIAVLPRAEEGTPRPVLYRTAGALAPEEGGNVTAHVAGVLEGASVHHLLVAGAVGAHYHRAHDETVIVLSGEGRITVEGETQDVAPGLVLLLPRGTVHALEVTGKPVEAVSVFSPPFDGEDRILVE